MIKKRKMKKTTKQLIPVHQMDEQFSSGIAFSYIEMTDGLDGLMMNAHKNEIHRDDYYMFLFVEKATAIFTLDFEEIRWQKAVVFYVRPGQVHFVSSAEEMKGWFLAIDPMFVEKEYKEMFENQFHTQQPVSLDASSFKTMREAACLFDLVANAKQEVFNSQIILNMANVFIGLITEQYSNSRLDVSKGKSRQAMIAAEFRNLLVKNVKTMKSPSQYAKKLNYSLSHLNESVKSVTGFPVSYWIHQQIVLETKRLLYYTDIDVKEIAFSLGYEDHTYFSRLFTKTAGIPPTAFRQKFHE